MDFYTTLGVLRSASPAEIKEAYRERAKQLHPDLNPHAGEGAFKALNEAYSVLSDAVLRRAYDASKGYAPQSPSHPPFGGGGAGSAHRPVDYEAAAAAAEAEWRRQNFGPEGSARRLREAAARAAARAAAGAPPPAPGAEVGSRKAWSGSYAAARGASETGAYREWAGAWRAQQAASQRMWGRLGAVGAVAGAVGLCLLAGSSPLFSARDAALPTGGRRAAPPQRLPSGRPAAAPR
jgi:curved DNA-binding protein CbpA